MKVRYLAFDPYLGEAALKHGFDLRIQFGDGRGPAFFFLEESCEKGIIHSTGKFSTTARLFLIAVNTSLVGFRAVNFVISKELANSLLGADKYLLRSFVNADRRRSVWEGHSLDREAELLCKCF